MHLQCTVSLLVEFVAKCPFVKFCCHVFARLQTRVEPFASNDETKRNKKLAAAEIAAADGMEGALSASNVWQVLQAASLQGDSWHFRTAATVVIMCILFSSVLSSRTFMGSLCAEMLAAMSKNRKPVHASASASTSARLDVCASHTCSLFA